MPSQEVDMCGGGQDSDKVRYILKETKYSNKMGEGLCVNECDEMLTSGCDCTTAIDEDGVGDPVF